jgi:hypothetical protein
MKSYSPAVFAIASIPGYAAERQTHTPEEYSCHEKGYAVDSAEFNKCMQRYENGEIITDEELCSNVSVDVHPNPKDDADYTHCLKRLASGDKAYTDYLACAHDNGQSQCGKEPPHPARVTVAPPYQGPPLWAL